MNLFRAALVAAVATVVLWTAKAVAIGVAGGLDRSPLEAPLFFLGLVACVVTTLLVGAAAVGSRGWGRRVVGGLASLVAVSVLGTLAQLVVEALQPARPGWVYGEVNLWVVMLALLAAAVAVSLGAREDTGDRERRPRARAGAGALP